MYHKPGRGYAGDQIHRQAVELERRGVRVRVLCPVPRIDWKGLRPGGGGRTDLHTLGTIEVDGVLVSYIPYVNVPLAWSPSLHAYCLERAVVPWLGRLAEDWGFSALHAHRLFPTGYVATRLGRAFGLPVVLSAVGSDVHTVPKRNGRVRRLTRRAIERCDRVTAVSRALATELNMLGRPLNPVKVLYRGVDVDLFHDRLGRDASRRDLDLPSDGPGFCTVCRLVEGKGLTELVQALGQLLRGHPDAWLAIIGDGPLRGDLRERIARQGLADRVLILGPRPHEEVPIWLAASDVFVLASHREGLPNVVREAMACARPVVATDVGGTAEVVEDGVTGILVPPQDPEALFRAFDRLVSDMELARQMGAAGRRKALAEFSLARSAEELAELYAGL